MLAIYNKWVSADMELDERGRAPTGYEAYTLDKGKELVAVVDGPVKPCSFGLNANGGKLDDGCYALRDILAFARAGLRGLRVVRGDARQNPYDKRVERLERHKNGSTMNKQEVADKQKIASELVRIARELVDETRTAANQYEKRLPNRQPSRSLVVNPKDDDDTLWRTYMWYIWGEGHGAWVRQRGFGTLKPGETAQNEVKQIEREEGVTIALIVL